MISNGYEADRVQAQSVANKILTCFPADIIRQEEVLPLTISKHNGNAYSKLTRLYAFIDKIFGHFSELTSCHKGCSNCCSLTELAVMEIEILYIEKLAKKKRRVRPRPQNEIAGKPCPFLIEDACSIYPYRPYVCRKHVSFAPTHWCRPETRDTAEFPLLQFDKIEEAFSVIMVETGKTKVRDIREVF